MAETQQIAIWPSSVKEIVERRETPFKLLDHKAGMISRFLWWVLKKMRRLQPYSETVRTWAYVPHQQDELHNAMLKALEEARFDMHDVYDDNLVFLIGGQDFSSLAAAPAFGRQMMFETGPFGMQSPYYGRRMFDIPIHVVPNMMGLAVVPRAIIEK